MVEKLSFRLSESERRKKDGRQRLCEDCLRSFFFRRQLLVFGFFVVEGEIFDMLGETG